MEKAICEVKNLSMPNIPSLTLASFYYGKQSADGFGKPLESDKMSFEVCLRFSIMRSPRFMVGTVRIPVEGFFASIFSRSFFLYNSSHKGSGVALGVRCLNFGPGFWVVGPALSPPQGALTPQESLQALCRWPRRSPDPLQPA